jgi:hypothetical protein
MNSGQLSRGRSARWRVAISAVVAGNLAACGGSVAAGPSESPSAVASARASIAPSVSPTPTASPTVVPVRLIVPEAVPLTPLQSLALPDAEMWVFIPTADGIWTVHDPGDALVLRDPATFNEIRRIKGAATIHATAIGFGAAWSTDYDTDTLHRYDLETGEHTAIAVGPGPDGILATTDAIWVADHKGDSVERLDPATNELLSIKVRDTAGRGGPGGMVEADGSLFVSIPLLEAGPTRPPGGLAEIDLTTNTRVRTIELDMLPCDIAHMGGRIWLAACSDAPAAVAYLEPGDELAHVVKLADHAFFAGRYGGRDWLLQDGQLVAVETDPLRATDARSLDGPIGGMIAIGQDQWIMLDGRMVRVDPKEFEVGTS